MIEAQFKIQLRIANFKFEQAQTVEEVQNFHAGFVDTFNTTAHYAHQERNDDRETPMAVRAAREVIIEHAQVKPGMKVLDQASGHGEPSLAELVGPEGHVTATELSDGLLALAGEKAKRAGLTNMTFRTMDSHDLQFPDGTFDRVTCRLAVMYFADYPAALRDSAKRRT